MTEQLYYEDVYQKEFDAAVTECAEGEDGYHLYLSRSAFFPEGGGQNGDRGYLVLPGSGTDTGRRIEVKDTQSDGDEIYVVCREAVPEGTPLHGVLDWTYRFDRMQNHSGEHIVSGIIHSLYGYQNVGFHMSDDRMIIDLSGDLSDEQLSQIERKANEVVWSNAEIRTDVYTEEEAENVEFRSKKELHGIIRVVTIPGADVCACCGTHVSRTGEIGAIRLVSHERIRGGVRIEMMCGRWAYEYMSGIFRQNREVSALVSARPLATAGAVRKVLDTENDLKSRLVQARYREIDRMARELAGKGNLLIFADGCDAVLVQKIAAKVMETCGGSVWAMSGSDTDGYHYAAGEKGGDLRQTVKEMNANLNGKGGGRPYFQQGSVQAGRHAIEAYLKEVVPDLSILSV